MVWLSVLATIGYPPNMSRRIYSDTDSPALSACSFSLSPSAVVMRIVRLEGKRVSLMVFFFIAFLPFRSVRNEVPNTPGVQRRKPLASL